MRYKGRAYALGVSKTVATHLSWSNYRCCPIICEVNEHERTGEANFKGKLNSVGRR
jgi:hypothetical protein